MEIACRPPVGGALYLGKRRAMFLYRNPLVEIDYHINLMYS